MQPAEYYLKELLFYYDCVTIPGLGGFIMQSQPARINKGKNRINPPSRHPSFNSMLNHDDGLLISTIAKSENISYRDAGLVVRDFTEDCKKRMSVGEKIILESIGELSSDPEGGILFRQSNQSNFFAGAFGMESLNLYPLTRPQSPSRISQKPVDRKPRQLREKKTASVRWTLIISMPVILFLLYGIIFPSSIQDIYTNYSGLVFDFEYPQGTPPIAPAAVSAPAAKAPETKTEIVTEPVVTVVQVSPKYYIIGGCFEKEENAGKFLAELINRGFDAEKAGANNRGHVRISYKSFPDKISALPYLQKIRNEENAAAWLLKF